jgi:hypothetical protein
VSGWDYDYKTTYKNDPKNSSAPRLKITTHPVSLGEGTCARGRVNNVYVNGYVTDAGSDDPVLRPYLLYGRKGLETGAVAEIAMGSTIAEGSEDVTTRIPVDGVNTKSAARLRVVQSGAASDARIYGLALDIEPSNTIS